MKSLSGKKGNDVWKWNKPQKKVKRKTLLVTDHVRDKLRGIHFMETSQKVF